MPFNWSEMIRRPDVEDSNSKSDESRAKQPAADVKLAKPAKKLSQIEQILAQRSHSAQFQEIAEVQEAKKPWQKLDYMYEQEVVDKNVELLMSKSADEVKTELRKEHSGMSKEELDLILSGVKEQGPTRFEEPQILAALRTIKAGEAEAKRYTLEQLIARYKKIYRLAPDLK